MLHVSHRWVYDRIDARRAHEDAETDRKEKRETETDARDGVWLSEQTSDG
jgi:hypothetical protein